MSDHDIELVRAQEDAPLTISRAELERRLQEMVVETLTARDEFMWEPFFRLRRIANEMKRLQTVPEKEKWEVFYQRFGCMRCKTQERTHTGNGFCSDCYKWALRTLKSIVQETSANNQASATPIHLRDVR